MYVGVVMNEPWSQSILEIADFCVVVWITHSRVRKMYYLKNNLLHQIHAFEKLNQTWSYGRK